MSESRRQPPPRGLGDAGKKLWNRIASQWEVDGREYLLLDQAARTADLIVELERLLESDGPVTVGSAGQPKLNSVIGELRAQRAILERLLQGLSLPAEQDAPRISRRHQRAAERRWAVS